MSLIQQHLDKLPLTAQALAEEAETREGYAIRRIQRMVEQYKLEQFCPKRWQLVRRAGVARVVADPQVRSAIDIALEALCI